MKKLTTLFLALVVCAGILFASETSVDGIWYNFDDGNLTAKVTFQENKYYEHLDRYSGEVVIPASVTYNAQTYTITSIGDQAFWNCTGLTSVTIPNSVTSIGDQAFYGCSDLTSVTIPNSVTSIGDIAFRNCSGLTSVTIPNSVTSIGNYAFNNCTGLTEINVTADNPNYRSEEGVLFNRDKTTLVAYPPGKQGGKYTIPNSVTSIGMYAFSWCSGLTSVTIPNSVTSIGDQAFWSCSNLTSVTIPNSVTSIGDFAFRGCSGLTSVTIPNSVTSIGSYAFQYCTGLTSLSVEAGNTVYDSRNNCNAIIETSTNTLIFGCQNTTIPNSVTSIGRGAFSGCTSLTSVTIPNSVTSIGSSAFGYCTGLTSVTIPNSVTSIGDEAFRNCSGLTSITNYATTPQSINSNVFNNVNKSTCKLYVPMESASLYQAAESWSDFPVCVILSAKADPDDASAFYTTFYHGSQKYKLPAGMEAYTATINGDVLELTKVAEGGDVIPACTAFILKSNASNLTMDITDETPVSIGENILQGVDAATPAPANCYVLSGGSSDKSVQGIGFYRFSGTLGAHKAYLVLAPKAGAPRRLRFAFSETNTTTNVEQVPSKQVPNTKVIENGQLYILYNGTKYNVQGSRVH